jgi:hypothetical protein
MSAPYRPMTSQRGDAIPPITSMPSTPEDRFSSPTGARPTAARRCSQAQCGAPYWPRRSDSQFCSEACRQRAHLQRVSRDTSVTTEPKEGPREL